MGREVYGRVSWEGGWPEGKWGGREARGKVGRGGSWDEGG